MSTSTTETLHVVAIADDSAPLYQQVEGIHQHDSEPVTYLPVYTEREDGPHITILDLDQVLANDSRAKENDLRLWQTFIDCNPGWTADQSKGTVIEKSFFSAIEAGEGDLMVLMIENGLVTANTILPSTHETPLLRAVRSKNVKLVRKLLDLGAEKDGFGVVVC